MCVEHVVAAHEKLVSGKRVGWGTQTINDLLMIRLNMEKVSAVDLRPLAKRFYEKSRHREMNIQQHMSREFFEDCFSALNLAMTPRNVWLLGGQDGIGALGGVE